MSEMAPKLNQRCTWERNFSCLLAEMKDVNPEERPTCQQIKSKIQTLDDPSLEFGVLSVSKRALELLNNVIKDAELTRTTPPTPSTTRSTLTNANLKSMIDETDGSRHRHTHFTAPQHNTNLCPGWIFQKGHPLADSDQGDLGNVGVQRIGVPDRLSPDVNPDCNVEGSFIHRDRTSGIVMSSCGNPSQEEVNSNTKALLRLDQMDLV